MLILALFLFSLPVISQETTPKPKIPPFKLKSPELALGLSLALTVVPVAICWITGVPGHTQPVLPWASLLAFGLILGPSAGYVYGGLEYPALAGIGIRCLGAAMTYFGGGGTITTAGIVVIAASVLWDILSVNEDVRKHNLELQKKNLTVAPIVIPDKKGPGLGIQFRLIF